MTPTARLTYVFHSGFAVETSTALLLFDIWLDPSNIVQRLLQTEKPVYVFVSHFHEDHFSSHIFEWRRQRKDLCYILSKDILRHRRATREQADVWMAAGGTWNDDRISVRATGSNDSGVSWVVRIDGITLFHAGDLNNWYARFLEGDNPEQEIYSQEMETHINPVAEEKRYLGELKIIARETHHFDIVMFPVDGRIGNGYTRGARQFLQQFGVELFVPMHFVVSGNESAWRMREFIDSEKTVFWAIQHEGEQLEYFGRNTE